MEILFAVGRLRAMCVAAALVALVPRPAVAQSPPPVPPPRVDETVIVTAVAAPVALRSLGRTVVLITREEIEQLGFSSVIDALRLAPGVDVRARGPHGVQTDLSIRGATFGQNLVLVDGLRLNDAQSGHHNAEIPLAIAALDRIEIVSGPGSAVHGADALGGTINVVSRRDPHLWIGLAAGQFGSASVDASASGGRLPAGLTLSGWASRSGDFDVPRASGGVVRSVDRGFAQGGAGVRAAGAAWTLAMRHQRRAFGANQFYGNSPSKEWTDQTMASAAWRHGDGGWTIEAQMAGRVHHDHFRWDIARPGFAENRHRTDAVEAGVALHRGLGGRGRLSLGSGAGGDRVRSSNLGDHGYGRAHGFTELLWSVAPRATVQAGARVDTYSRFGTAWTPSAAVSVAIAPDVRVRGSVARAFRVPTFTELYYRDPANLGRDDLTSETGWAFDAGVDASLEAVTISATAFERRDRNVIDWVRARPEDLWRSTNVRDVRTRGVEIAAARRWSGALVRVTGSGVDVDAPALTLLSKYVLEYARYSVGVSAAVPVGAGFRVGMHADRRVRYDGQRHTLVRARVSRRVGDVDLFVSGSNLLNARYSEIAHVDMPGRWVMTGLTIR